MRYVANYRCDTCTATKRLIFDSERRARVPEKDDFPDILVCGWRECKGKQRRVRTPVTN